MRISIMQPGYLPWLGYFDRIARSDLHVVLDHVQLEKNSFTNRNRLRRPSGWCWVTVPIETSGRFGDLPIRGTRIARDSRWRRKHLGSIESLYSASPFFREYIRAFRDIYAFDWEWLAALCESVTTQLLTAFEISVPQVRSSEMGLKSRKAELILDICRSAGASTYISGPLGRRYLDLATFARAGIELLFHEYRHPEYSQTFPGFEPYMSAVDLLFNHGPESRRILSEGQTLSTS
jgi:hypothetical protein